MTVLRAAGEQIRIHSDSSHSIFMLPWTVTRGDRSYDSFNLDLSRAIAALLPEKFLDREEVADEANLARGMAIEAHSEWQDDLYRERAEDLYGWQLTPLKQRFRLEHQRVGVSCGYVVLNSNCTDRQNQVWSGHLAAADLGPIEFELSLTVTPTGMASLDPFLHDYEKLVLRVRQLKWLVSFAESHPGTKISISYHDDRSLDQDAQTFIRSNLRRLNLWTTADSVGPLLDRSIGVTVDVDRARNAVLIVLPDGRAVLNDISKETIAGRPSPPIGAVIPFDGPPIP